MVSTTINWLEPEAVKLWGHVTGAADCRCIVVACSSRIVETGVLVRRYQNILTGYDDGKPGIPICLMRRSIGSCGVGSMCRRPDVEMFLFSVWNVGRSTFGRHNRSDGAKKQVSIDVIAAPFSAIGCRRMFEQGGLGAACDERWSVPASCLSVNWLSAEGCSRSNWFCDSGDSCDAKNRDIILGRVRRSHGNRRIGRVGDVDYRGRAAGWTSRSTLVYTAIGGNGGARRLWDGAFGDQKTDQNRDMDNAGWARTIPEALEDKALQCGPAPQDDIVAVANMVHSESMVS